MDRRIAVPLVIAGVIALGIVLFLVRSSDDQRATLVPLPRDMAAIGDSITQAVALDRESLTGAPEHSWATGTNPDDIVTSHAERLIGAGALGSSIYNNSIPGARVADTIEQAEATVQQGADYVVILIGANDVCAPDAASMTSVDAFRASFTRVMDTLRSGLADSSVLVLSIPNVYRLWEVGREQPFAQTIWDGAGICGSVLSANISEDARRSALTRTEQFNDVLQEVCGSHPRCRYDDDAVFDYEFDEDSIGPVDYFHPSIEGQANIADISWEQGFWPDL